MRLSQLPILISLFFVSGCSACNECSFWSRCDGNVVETCGEGPDQVVGREIRRFPCEDPNPVCVTHGDRDQYATCARSEEATCDRDTFENYCEDNNLVECMAGYEILKDCAPEGPTCVVSPEGAFCAIDPVTTCDRDNYPTRCEENLRYGCLSSGLEYYKTCEVECVESDKTAAVYCSD